jgi:protein O-mannosyl-transferase
MKRKPRKSHPKAASAVTPCVAEAGIAIDPTPLRRLPLPSWLKVVGLWLVCVTAATLIYRPSFQFPLVFDDLIYLQGNPLLTDLNSFTFPLWFEAFFKEAILLRDQDLGTNFVMRPLAYLTFHLNWQIHGWEPWGYRLVNAMIHGCNATLFFLAVRALTSTCTWPRRTKLYACAISAGLFLVHPLAVQSTVYITQRFTSLAVMFYLATFLAHLKAQAALQGSTKLTWTSVSVVLLVCGLLCKECLFTAPIMFLLYAWLVQRRPFLHSVYSVWPLLLCMLITPGMILLVTPYFNQGALSLSAVLNVDGIKDAVIQPQDYLASQLVIWWRYLATILWPFLLNPDPICILRKSFLDPAVLASVLGLMLVFGTLGILSFRKGGSTTARVALFAALWFLVALSPSSSVFVLPDLAADHRCHLSSLAIFTLAGLGLARLTERWGKSTLIGTLSLLLALSLLTQQRLNVWRDPIQLWSFVVEGHPDNIRAHSNLGAHCGEEGDYERALLHTKIAREMDKRHHNATTNLIRLLSMKGKYTEAWEVCMEYVRLVPRAGACPEFNWLGSTVLIGLGEHKLAAQILENVLRARPDLAEARLSYATVLLHFSRTAEAREQLSWVIAHSADTDAVGRAEQAVARL